MILITILAMSSVALALFVLQQQRNYLKSIAAWMRSTGEIQNEIISTIESMNDAGVRNATQTTDNFKVIGDRLDSIESDKLEVALPIDDLTPEQSFEVAKTKALLGGLERDEIEQAYLDLLTYQYRYKNTSVRMLKEKIFTDFSITKNA